MSLVFQTLNRFGNNLIFFNDSKVGCFKCSLKYRKVEKEKLFLNFFRGLNENLDEMRGRILAIKPLPSIHEVFSKVK